MRNIVVTMVAHIDRAEIEQVLLAAVAALTHRQDEARQAAAEVMRIQPDFTIGSWLAFLRLSDPAYMERLGTGLRLAGLPD